MQVQPLETLTFQELEIFKNEKLVTPHLFVLYDTGETEFLAPVIKRLEEQGKDYRILVMGTAAEVIKNKDLPESKILTLDSLNIEKKVDKTWPRENGLNEFELETIHSQLKIFNLISGFASIIQNQLIKEFKSEARTFVVWDNFAATFSKDALAVAKKVQHSAHKVLYPSGYVANSMDNRPDNFAIVGHPSLETFALEFAKISPKSVREKLCIPPDQKVMAYLGGWNQDEDYRQGFEIFAQCLTEKTFEDTLFVIQPHPKCADGAFEKEMMHKYGVKNFLVPSEKTVNSLEVVAISEGPVICHKSSIGVKVASLGKKIIHIVPEKDEWTNALIEAHVSPKISSAGSFKKFIESSSDRTIGQDIYSMMMMPQNATDCVIAEIEENDSVYSNELSA